MVIAAITGRRASTIGKVLAAAGAARGCVAPRRDPVRRYERERRGELIDVDKKKMGR